MEYRNDEWNGEWNIGMVNEYRNDEWNDKIFF